MEAAEGVIGIEEGAAVGFDGLYFFAIGVITGAGDFLFGSSGSFDLGGFNQQVATWKLARSAPKDQEKLTITLSQPLTQTANARGTITWARPAPKTGGTDPLPVNIAGAPI